MMVMADRYPKDSNLIMPFGSFYTYENAQFNFNNLDKIIKYMNANYKDMNFEVKYSTPSEYLAALKKENNKYNVFDGDLTSI